MTLDDILAPALRRETVYEQRQYVENELCRLAANKQLYLTDTKKLYDLHTRNLVNYCLTGVSIDENNEMEPCPIPDELSSYLITLKALTQKHTLIWKGPARVVRVVRKRPIYEKQVRKLEFDEKGLAVITIQKALEVLYFYGKNFNPAKNDLMRASTWLCEEVKPENYTADYTTPVSKTQKMFEQLADKLDEKQLDKLIKSLKAS